MYVCMYCFGLEVPRVCSIVYYKNSWWRSQLHLQETHACISIIVLIVRMSWLMTHTNCPAPISYFYYLCSFFKKKKFILFIYLFLIIWLDSFSGSVSIYNQTRRMVSIFEFLISVLTPFIPNYGSVLIDSSSEFIRIFIQQYANF